MFRCCGADAQTDSRSSKVRAYDGSEAAEGLEPEIPRRGYKNSKHEDSVDARPNLGDHYFEDPLGGPGHCPVSSLTGQLLEGGRISFA